MPDKKLKFYTSKEPLNTRDPQVTRAGKPKSVWSAIALLFRDEQSQWELMARKLWRLKPSDAHMLLAEAVMRRIETTDKRTPGKPGEVWVDPAGIFRLQVSL